MNDLESEEPPLSTPADNRSARWLSDQVPRWTLVLAVVGAGAGGTVAGLLIAGGFSADWVEAGGTWAGVFVTAGAVVVAYWALTSDALERRFERRVNARRERQALENQQRQEAADAALVTASVAFGSGHNLGQDDCGVRASSAHMVRVEAANQSGAVATDLTVTLRRPDGEPPVVVRFTLVREYDRVPAQELGLTVPLRMTEDDGSVLHAAGVEVLIEFSMHGGQWERHDDEAPVRIS